MFEAWPGEGEDAWVFAYGSLMWDPCFPYVEARRALLRGYHRALCILSILNRGTVDRPGLALGLDRGGSCRGFAFRIDAPHLAVAKADLWRREMTNAVYQPKILAVSLEGAGRVPALVFMALREHAQYRGDLRPEQAATLVAQGAGAYGSALDYLRNVVRHLDEFGIDDCPLHRVLTLAEAKVASAREGSVMIGDRAVVHSGGCQCGAVRYALFAHPERVHICHCRMCQKAVGGPFAALAPVRLADFAWTRGTPGAFRSSSVAARDYCAGCGTPLTFRYLDSEWIDVTIGSLDRPRDVPPRQQFGIESRMPWFDYLAALPATTTSESMERDRQARLINHQHPDHDTQPDWGPGE